VTASIGLKAKKEYWTLAISWKILTPVNHLISGWIVRVPT